MSHGTVVCFGLFPTTHIKCFPVNDLTGELTLRRLDYFRPNIFFAGMPFAFRQAGVVLGTFILVLVAIITDYSLILMVKGGELSGTKSYQVRPNNSRIYLYSLKCSDIK